MGKKLEPISIRLDPDVREGIQALAAEDERSLSAYINRVHRRHLEDAGNAPAPDKKGRRK